MGENGRSRLGSERKWHLTLSGRAPREAWMGVRATAREIGVDEATLRGWIDRRVVDVREDAAGKPLVDAMMAWDFAHDARMAAQVKACEVERSLRARRLMVEAAAGERCGRLVSRSKVEAALDQVAERLAFDLARALPGVDLVNDAAAIRDHLRRAMEELLEQARPGPWNGR